METDFYNTNLHIGYPFVDVDTMSFGGGSFVLSQSAVVDLGILFGVHSEFRPGEHKVWLQALRKENDIVTMVFNTNATEVPELLCSINIAVATFGNTYDITSTVGSTYATGYLVVGNPAALGSLPDGEVTTDKAEIPEVEPALLQSLSRGYVNSILLCNDIRTKTTPPKGCENSSPSSPSRGITDEATIYNTISSGTPIFREGYNASLTVSKLDNSLTFGAGRNFGMGMHCKELSYEPGDPDFPPTSSPSSSPDKNTKLLTGGPACSELLYTINGIMPDKSNGFVIQGSRGISVYSSPETHSLDIIFELTKKVACGIN